MFLERGKWRKENGKEKRMMTSFSLFLFPKRYFGLITI